MTRTTVAVLSAMIDAAGEKLYGLEIMRSASIQSGTLYPILERLEEAGWVEGEWEELGDQTGRPRRRYYSLTGLGTQQAYRATATAAARSSSRSLSKPATS